MVEVVIRPNRHSHPSKGGSMHWPKKTSIDKVWPRPKFIPADITHAEAGINPDEEEARAEEQNKNMSEMQGSQKDSS